VTTRRCVVCDSPVEPGRARLGAVSCLAHASHRPIRGAVYFGKKAA
jgi:hypothetical protein